MKTRVSIRCGMLTLLLIFSLILSPVVAGSGWFDKFEGTVVTNSASAWKLQQYGHYAGGSFSVRYNTGNRSLVHVSAPRISVGCGGIDAFWGGFSFLNPEYYVQMFRNIIQAAPAFAFELALKSLCEPCASVMDALNEIAQAMNALSVDECGISRNIAHAGAEAVASLAGWKSSTGKSGGTGPEWLNALKDFAGKASEFAVKIKEMLSFKFCGHLTGDVKDRCEIIYGTTGTFWQRILEYEKSTTNSGQPIFDEQAIEILRAFTGDVTLTADGKGIDGKKVGGSEPNMVIVKYEPSKCEIEASATVLLDMMMKKEHTPSDKIHVWPLDSDACTEVVLPAKLRIAERSAGAVNDIEELITANPTGNISTDVQQIINQNSLPLYKLINLYSLRYHNLGLGFISDDERNILIDLAALGHASYIIDSSIKHSNALMAMITSELVPVVAEAGGSKDAVLQALDHFRHRIGLIQNELHQALSTKLKEHYADFDNLASVLRIQQSLEENVFKDMYK